jgi:hypothetical protein
MRKWGIVITVFYALIILVLIVPGTMFLTGYNNSSWQDFFQGLGETYGAWGFWVLAGAILASQALLLFLSVDTSQKRLKPRAHILVSCSVAAFLTALLTTAVTWSLGVAIRGDKFSIRFLGKEVDILAFWGALWVLWGIVFYLYSRNSIAVVSRLISWLLKGSVLELLIVVPCHVIVRRRDDCSAPLATSFGIATGIAIMLLSFGPSVLVLYKKRLDAYSTRGSA